METDGLADQDAEPDEERQVGLEEIVRQLADRDDRRLLDHVGGVDPAREAAIEAQRDHPPQAIAMRLDQPGPGVRVSLGGPADLLDLAGCDFGCLHKEYLARPGRSVTRFAGGSSRFGPCPLGPYA